jgi:phosphohistidine phosphatase
VIGHNPGLEDLAKLLIRNTGAEPARRLHEKFPTAAVAVIVFDGEWTRLGPGAGEVQAFIRPRDL